MIALSTKRKRERKTYVPLNEKELTWSFGAI
jgi:hypothetical protein